MEWFQPRCLQSPEVYSKKEEEVAVTSKTRSAHKLGKGGQKGKFKPVGGKRSLYEGVVFVPSTPGSLLRKELQKCEDKFTRVQKIKSVKFVERGGTTIRSLLVKSNPFQPTHCGWEQCWPCNSF